jgi:DNA modification methylase
MVMTKVTNMNAKAAGSKKPGNKLNRIWIGDCRRMKAVPDNSVHLLLTSPPYNVEMEYEDKLSVKEYEDFTLEWITEGFRTLVEGGRIAINVGNMGRKPYYFLSDLIVRTCLSLGMLARGEIIWFKGWSMAAGGTKWGSWCDASNPVTRDCHEYIIVFSKGTYKLDCTGFEKDIENGTAFAQNTLSVWYIKPETSRDHPAPFPVELAKRLIQLYTRPGMTVLDPFIGSGTTAVAAMVLARPRKFIGYELDDGYARAAIKRIRSCSNHKIEEYVNIKEPVVQHQQRVQTLDAFM